MYTKYFIMQLKWTLLELNQRPSDYESDALTNCAKGPSYQQKFIQKAKTESGFEPAALPTFSRDALTN